MYSMYTSMIIIIIYQKYHWDFKKVFINLNYITVTKLKPIYPQALIKWIPINQLDGESIRGIKLSKYLHCENRWNNNKSLTFKRIQISVSY